MAIADINQKIVGGITSKVTGGAIVNALGWLLVGMVAIGITGWLAYVYFENKKYNKKIKVYSIVHGYFHLSYLDTAKEIRLGKGGFAVLYLKKMKTWKLAGGARIGMNDYTFYILPDGYWYPGQISADLRSIDKDGGLLSVHTTNPTMRSQYTSLEKQIDQLHGDKKGFWDKYGQWVISIAFIAIMGIFVWLSFREWSAGMNSFKGVTDQLTALAESLNKLTVNLNSNQPSGLVPAV